MADILGLGDNCVDIYVDQDIQFPGGNAVNVAVFAKKLGANASYLGCVGSDPLGDLIKNSLFREGVGTERLRVGKDIKTPWTRIRHTDGDRFFDGSVLPEADDYKLTAQDYLYMGGFDLVHTSVYSKLDAEIEKIHQASKILSYDFSDKFNDHYLEEIVPHVDIAIVSLAEATDAEAKDICRSISARGPITVIATRGAKGALCLDEDEFFSTSIVETKVVDTLGAGDGFIAGYLVAHLNGDPTGIAMRRAAANGALVCSSQGAFGRGVPLMQDQPGISAPNKPAQ